MAVIVKGTKIKIRYSDRTTLDYQLLQDEEVEAVLARVQQLAQIGEAGRRASISGSDDA